MTGRPFAHRRRLAVSIGALTAALAFGGMAAAQTASTSAIRGNADPGAQVVARNVATGFTTRDTADDTGDYSLLGLAPGTYEVTAAGRTQTVRVLVGQTATVDLVVSGATDEIVVTARAPAADPTTSEVATNVTQEQIDNLPQLNRNFLSFAALAPGVRVSQDEREVAFSAGGQNPLAVNVFIDGQSQKSQIIDGGVSGQDDSRGNPFPQLAVQEFRVITQNFKAEYEQSSSAIITAVTRSGTNDFQGEVFGQYQNQNWIANDYFTQRRGDRKPDLTRKQYGGLISGPIVEDRLHFLFTYEKKEEDRNSTVFLGRSGYEDLFGQFEGNIATPFQEDLYFGKLSWQASDNHRVDLSFTYRDEQDIRDVGGQDAFERANALKITEKKGNLRWQWQGAAWLNEFQVDYLESNYNPTALNFSETGAEFVVFRDADNTTAGFQFDVNSRDATVIRLGGRDSNQNIVQESLTFRNDTTFDEFDWYGGHTIKAGIKLTKNNYFVEKEFGRNPFFVYDVDARPEITGSRDIPVRVTVGSPVPAADVDNNVIGLYVQDDWQVTDNLELNLGIRWDYEDNAFNNNYRTPENIVALLNAYRTLPGYNLRFNPDDYISNGDREAFKGAFQPRIGFSYDVFGDERTVVFGGAGRYYDRVPYNFAFDERFKPTQFVREIFFSLDGSRPGTVAWDPAYLTAAGLQPLLDAQPLAGEVFLIRNEAEPPVTDQFNFGLRQRFGDWRTAATLAYAKTDNGFQWNIANLGPGENDRFNGPTPTSLGFPEFRNLVFISSHESEREFRALYLTADKPFTEFSGWGVSVSYTLSKAEQNGSRDTNTAPFDFDFARVSLSPTYPSPNDERHRVVASGIVALPWDMKLSTLVTLGSGTPYNVFDDTVPGQFTIRWNEGRPPKDDFLFFKDAFAYQQIDLRLTKTFELWQGHEFEVILDAINVTNNRNFSCFEGYTGTATNPNPRFGQPNCQLLPTRSLQVGARYRW
jgi:hypothetical protein